MGFLAKIDMNDNIRRGIRPNGEVIEWEVFGGNDSTPPKVIGHVPPTGKSSLVMCNYYNGYGADYGFYDDEESYGTEYSHPNYENPEGYHPSCAMLS